MTSWCRIFEWRVNQSLIPTTWECVILRVH
jgi:hypothetical protein